MDGRRWAEGYGRGLGLWIASRFAALLGGELDVRAPADGGSCFRVTLPGPVTWAPGSLSRPRPLRLRLDGQLVVLLEDDASVLEATRLAFLRRGATVIAARNQVEFWNEIEQLPRPPDLCVFDFFLGPNGPLARVGTRATSANDISWVRNRFGDRTKVVVLSAEKDHPQLAGVWNAPVLAKPLTDETMDEIAILLRVH
jgi:CheY-like chemotaxis protein